jgi:hypothetical protein
MLVQETKKTAAKAVKIEQTLQQFLITIAFAGESMNCPIFKHLMIMNMT